MTDIDFFDSNGFLEHTGHDSAFAKEIIEESLRVMPEYTGDMQTAIKAGDLDEIRRTAHRLKGGMRTIYAGAAAGYAEEIESAAKKGDLILCRHLMEMLESVFTHTISSLECFLKNLK
jgi:HPt (histidine-containing phosphotransfer) domain-containing protein